MQKETFILLCFIPLLIWSCQKDNIRPAAPTIPAPTPLPDCSFNFTEEAVNFDSTFGFICPSLEPVTLYKYPFHDKVPFLNPSNPNEIGFLRWQTNPLSSVLDLMVFDMCSGETRPVTDKAYYDVDWSVKDWMIFTSYDQNIYKIKSNGDSLTQLTFDNSYNYNATWNDEGTQFAYISDNYGLQIADQNGLVIDTYEDFHGTAINWWGDYITYRCSGSFCIGAFLPQEKEFQIIEENQDRHYIHKAIILSDNKTLWDDFINIGMTNLQTSEKETFTHNASNRNVSLSDLSSDEKTIVLHRTNVRKIDECYQELDPAVYLMDIDGSNERRVLIPGPE